MSYLKQGKAFVDKTITNSNYQYLFLLEVI